MNEPAQGPDRSEIVWRKSAPDTIESDLARLWREAGQSGAISRALMSNLVVVSPLRSFPAVDEIARRHPARTILLDYTAGSRRAGAPDTTQIGLLTIGEPTARYGVELIAIHTACADASIPSIVRALTFGDVPTTVWWTGDLSNPVPPPALTTAGRQFVYDSRCWHDVKQGAAVAAGLLEQADPPDLADLNWRRIAAIRGALVHVLCGEKSRDLKASRVDIAYRAGESSAAWLIGGWFSAGMSQRLPSDSIRVQEASQREEILSVTIHDEGWSATASMSPDGVKVMTTNRPPFVVSSPHETEADAVAAELRSLGHDVGLQNAIRALSNLSPR